MIRNRGARADARFRRRSYKENRRGRRMKPKSPTLGHALVWNLSTTWAEEVACRPWRRPI